MMSEYGADTVAGLHTAGAEMFSEEFQVEFYRRLDAEFDKRPVVCGRNKLRKASGRSKYPMIRRYLNGETHLSKPQVSLSQYIT